MGRVETEHDKGLITNLSKNSILPTEDKKDLDDYLRNKSRFQIRLVAPAGTPLPTNDFPDPEDSTKTIHVLRRYLVNQRALVSVKTFVGASNNPVIDMAFTPIASNRLRTFTAAHLHEKLAFILDGTLISAPIVQAPFGDSAEISFSLFSSASECAKIRKLAATLKTLVPTTSPNSPPIAHPTLTTQPATTTATTRAAASALREPNKITPLLGAFKRPAN